MHFTIASCPIATTPAYCDRLPLTQCDRTTIAQVDKEFDYSVRFPQWVEIGREWIVLGKLLSGFRAKTIAQNALAQLLTSDKAQEVAA